MNKSSVLSIAFSGLLLAGCVDSDYNLTDIDTTAQFNVEDFVIPVNVDSIKLKSVIDLKETSKIKEVKIDGETIYALIEEGDFQSSKIQVPGFSTKSPDIPSVKDQMKLQMTEAGIKARDGSAGPDTKVAFYKLSDLATSFDVSASGIDKAVKAFKYAKVDAGFGMTLDVSELTKCLNRIHCENVKLQLIKGLSVSKFIFQGKEVDKSMYSYGIETGVLNLSELDLEFPDGKFTFYAAVDGLDAALAGIDFDAVKQTLDFSGVVKVLDGEVAIYSKDIKADGSAKSRGGRKGSPLSELLPANVSFQSDFNLSDIKIQEFTGDFEYQIKDISIAPVKLDDLPDLLSQKGTDIRLKNPQIYLNIYNPLAGMYGIQAQAGIKLTSVNGTERKSYDADELLNMNNEYERFLLSPNRETAYYEYTKYVPYSGLTNLLSGDGLPQSINIDVVNPMAPLQSVSGFRLDETIDPVTGTYEVFVPFELDEGSKVLYNDTINGWSDEDLDKLTITRLGLDMNVTTDVALDMVLKVYPMVIEGGKSVRRGDMVGTASIKASAKDQPVTVSMNGEIKRLDGLLFEASLLGVKNSKVLSPNSGVILKGLKAKVSGHYDKEL